MDLAAMTDAELDALAIQYKQEEQTLLEEVRARKTAVRDEIVRRANESYATQKLNALGITATPDTLRAVMEAN